MSEVAPQKTLNDVIYEMEVDFVSVLADKRIEFNQEAHFAIQAFQNNPYLLDVAKRNPRSLKNAIVNIAAVGLTLNPVSQLAYLVPRTINKQPSVCLDISYKGLIRAATDSGSILWAQAYVVYEKDEFEVLGAGEKPIHKHNPFSKDRGKKVGAYVIVKTNTGDFLTTTMSIEEIYDIRNASEAYKKGFGPWLNFEDEMIKKTVVKRAAKLWPRTSKVEQLEKAIDVINEHEGIDFKEDKLIDVDEDFPRNPEDMELGPMYLFIKGKFRGKRICEIELEEIQKYFEFLSSKREKDDPRYKSKDWLETFDAIEDYVFNSEYYIEREK